MRHVERLRFRAAAVVLALLGAGCVRTLTDFTVISTKNVDISRMGEYRRHSRRTRGRDIVHWIVVFPTTWTGKPELKPAINRAIQAVPGGVALIDGIVQECYWYIPLLYGQHSLIVEGTPLIDPKIAESDIPLYRRPQP